MSSVLTLTIRIALVLSIGGIWLFATATPSYACSCVPPASPSESLANSALVFQGRVSSVQELDRGDGTWGSLDPTTVAFEVSTVWKGPEHQTMYLTTAREGASCGFTFVDGEEYVVYSRDGSEVSLCSRTRNVSDAKADVEALGPGTTPRQGSVAPTPDVSEFQNGGGCGLPSASSDLSGLGLMAGLVWFGIRRGRRNR